MMTISLSSLFPPQSPHHFLSTALMLPSQLHLHQLCTKSAIRRQHAKAEVERGLPLLPQLKSSALVSAKGGGRSTGSDCPVVSPPTEALPPHAWTVQRLAFFLSLVQSFG